MNKIVRRHYPASKLPAELRGSIRAGTHVTVTIVEEAEAEETPSLDEIFAMRRPPFRTVAEIDADIRALRDEWDD